MNKELIGMSKVLEQQVGRQVEELILWSMEYTPQMQASSALAAAPASSGHTINTCYRMPLQRWHEECQVYSMNGSPNHIRFKIDSVGYYTY